MNRIYSFIKDFNDLFNMDKYISKKEVDRLFLRYDGIIDDINKIDDEVLREKVLKLYHDRFNTANSKNSKYIKRKLVEYKDYFDNMFKGIDNNIVLDEEQRRAILIDEDYSLVIAGAGSGKTTTMAAKVKYLVDKLHVKEDRILLLAFTNKACEELSTRINEDFKLNVEVLTFHKLGMKFLRKIMARPLQIVSAGTFNKIMEEYVTKYIFENKERLKDFLEVFDKFVYFDDKCLSFNTFDEYFKYYADTTYELNKHDLKTYCDLRIVNRLNYYTAITGERFKSKSEAIIANYLYKNSISFIYEKTYPHKVGDDRSYSPDFTLPNNGKEIYIEYYGLSKYKEDGSYTEEEIEFYKKLIDKKRNLHQKYSTDLIELYSDYDTETNYLKELSHELDKRFVTKMPKTYKEIFYKLLYTSKEVQYFRVVGLFYTFITRFKEQGNSLADFEFYINLTNDNLVKRQLEYIKEFYQIYESRIHSEYKIDFQDMINYAYRYTSKLKNRLSYDYIVIDEYQDISVQRYNFAKRISDIFNAKIVAVGDDWQAIYGFSGSDVDLFTKFYTHMGYAEIIKIQKTYRNSQELLDIAEYFMESNTNSFNKHLTSDKHLEKPVEIHYYDEKNPITKYECLEKIIRKIYNKNKNSRILLVGRFNSEKEELFNSKLFSKGTDNKIICRSVLNADIDFLTAHASKGLGYDEVILLNAINGKYGFPSQIEDEDVIKLLDYKKSKKDKLNEEMNLFYVTLTRTKNRVYILSPYLPRNKRSEFIKTIEEHENVDRKLEVFDK